MIEKANVVLYLVDVVLDTKEEIHQVIADIQSKLEGGEKQLILLANKADKGGGD